MVFSSIPAYLDPSNWQQQSNNQNIVTSELASHLLPPPPSELHGGGGSSGSIRPGSMAERARMANIPMPEGPLKCPRCESTNTKFCYYNNYSLSQPRHFCKTCRRYWTRGGALRNVPVGGGYRRNKRSKGSSSKTPAVSQTSTASSTSSVPSISSTADMAGLTHPQVTPLRFMAPLHPDFGDSDIGLSYCGTTIPANLGAPGDFNYQQLSLLGALDPSTGSYPSCGVMTQLGPVKMEENQGLNMPRNFMGFAGSDQYWTGGSSCAWTDLSGFSSSSSHPL